MYDTMTKLNVAAEEMEVARKQKASNYGQNLTVQVKDDRERHRQADVEKKVFVKTHFGPEDPNPSTFIDMKKQKVKMTQATITAQMEANERRRQNLMLDELQKDQKCVLINEQMVAQEDQLEQEHKRHKQRVLKEAWT